MTAIVEWDSGDIVSSGGSLHGSATVSAGTEYNTLVLPGASSTVDGARWDVTATGLFSIRFYVMMPDTFGGASNALAFSRDSSDTTSRIRLGGSGAPGQVRVAEIGNSELMRSAKNLMTASTEYRWEYQVDVSGGTLTAAVFPLGSDISIWESGELSGDFGDPATAFELGKFIADANWREIGLSRLLITDTYGTWLGRHASDSSAGYPGISVWDGGAPREVDVLGVWNGTSIDAAEVMGEWDGTAVQPVE